MIYKEVTEALLRTLGRFKGVSVVRYSGDDLNNVQHNYKTIQAYVDDVSYHQFNLTQNIAKVEYNVYILGFPEHGTPDEILDVQAQCYDVALYVLAFMDNLPEYRGIISVYDYDIMTLSHYTAQNNAGVKLSIVLQIPNGVNLCEMDDKFNDEPVKEEEKEISGITENNIGDIVIKPVKLPRNNNC